MLGFQLTLFSVYNDLFCLFLTNGNLTFDKFSAGHLKIEISKAKFLKSYVRYIKSGQKRAANFRSIIQVEIQSIQQML